MKKLLAIALVLILALSLLTACGGNNSGGKGTPSAPRNLTAVPGDGYVTLSWDPPADNGGLEVGMYNVTLEGSMTYQTKDTFYTYNTAERGIEGGTECTFTVSAGNPNGWGPEAKVKATPTGSGSNGGNNDGNNDGRLVLGQFSLKAPDGWEIKVNEGDPEARDPNSDAYIQLTFSGHSSPTATAEETIKWHFDTFNMGEPSAVKVNGHDAKTNSRKDVYYIPGKGMKIAIVSFYKVDDAVRDAALATFKID